MGRDIQTDWKGKAIPVTARVLRMVDVYDALITVRPYKKALPPAGALAVMEDEVRRGWWDPEVFAMFVEMLGQEGVLARRMARAAGAD